MEVALWLIGGMGGTIIALIGFLWRDLKAEMKLVRDRTHTLAGSIQQHELRISSLEKWREKVDK